MSQSKDNTFTSYGAVLSFDSISQLHTSGWKVILSPQVKQDIVQLFKRGVFTMFKPTPGKLDISAIRDLDKNLFGCKLIVSVSGEYNAGKVS